MKLIILLVVVFIATECHAERFPNIRYLGMGYNLIKGNPDDQYYDPGYLFSVLKFTWNNEDTTSDGKYEVPNEVQALQIGSCGYESLVRAVFGEKSYQESLDVEVSVEAEAGIAGLVTARFSASTGYQKVSKSTEKSNVRYSIAKAKCIAYEVAVNYRQTGIEVTDDFFEAVNKLPSKNDDLVNETYFKFIETYGTHITTRLTMGAKMVVTSKIEQSERTKMEKKGVSVEVSAEVSTPVASFGASTKTDSQTQDKQSSQSSRNSYSTSFRGSLPPTNGGWEIWAQSVGKSPYPISYKLLPVLYLLNNKMFPELSVGELNEKRQLLLAAYADYCNKLPVCNAPRPDPIPPDMHRATSDFVRTSAQLPCPPDYHVVSCGIKNTKKKDSNTLCDSSRHALSVGNNKCKCGDDNGAACVSWCSITKLNIRTESSTFNGSTNVSCPEHFNVLICIFTVVLLFR